MNNNNKIDKENVYCYNEQHGDEYIKATLYCCSCELYLCRKCDTDKHHNNNSNNNSNATTTTDGQQDKSLELSMHIRVPVGNINQLEDDEETIKSTPKQAFVNNKEKRNSTSLKNSNNNIKKNQQQQQQQQNNQNNNNTTGNIIDLPTFDDGDNGLIVGEDNKLNNTNKETNKLNNNNQNNEAKNVETEITFNNIYERRKTNSCALEEGEEDEPLGYSDDNEYLGDIVEPSDLIEATNVVQGVVEGVVELGNGIADGITGVISDPIKGAKTGGVKGFFKGVGRGISGVAIKPVKGSAGFIIRTAEGLRNTPEAIFTPSNQHMDILKEKEASHLLDGIYQGTLGLGKGLFDGVTGIIAEPIKGAQEGGGKGFIQGVGKGLLGAVCKPISGAMEFVSKPIEGLANTPQKIINTIEEQKLKRDAKKQQQQQQQNNSNTTNDKDSITTNNNNNVGNDKKNHREKQGADLVDLGEDDGGEVSLFDDFGNSISSNHLQSQTKLLDQKQNNNNNNNKSTTNTTTNNNHISSPSKKSPSVLLRGQSASQSQKEFNEKWLKKNQIIDNDSISSISFSG